MKKLFVILSVVCTFGLMAQVTSTSSIYDIDNLIKHGNYAQDLNQDRDKFVGTWKYQNGETTLIVKLEKKDRFKFILNELQVFYQDAITVKYKLIKNGNVLFDNLNSSFPNEYTNDNNAFFLINSKTNELKGSILDKSTNTVGHLDIEYINNNGLKFNLNGHYKHVPNNLTGTNDFELPLGDIQLTRI